MASRSRTLNGKDPLRHAAAQIARGEHRRRWIVRVIAIAVFLMAKTDLDAVLMAFGRDQDRFGTIMDDQRIEEDGGAVDAKIGVGSDMFRGQASLGEGGPLPEKGLPLSCCAVFGLLLIPFTVT